MKRLFVILILFAAGCTSQNENSPDTSQLKSSKEKVSAASVEGCYLSVFNKDTSRLKIIANDNRITGALSYKRFEKDSNNGTISGQIKDSLIVAYYTFQSEGIISVREVAFKFDSKGFLREGFGEIVIRNTGDTASFKTLSELNFHESPAFVKEECQ